MSVLQPPSALTPEHTVALSKKAQSFLDSQSSWQLPYPLSLFINSESQEKWAEAENIFLACLRAGLNETAWRLLEMLTQRFGKTNEHIAAFRGMYDEATAKSTQDLENTMKLYDEILREDSTLFSIRKRRAALLKSVGRPADAIGDLISLVDASPTDAEAWAELADLYAAQGAFEQSVYCSEEVILLMPNAWNMHAKLGETLYLSAQRLEGGEQLKALSESMRRFCRSIELCDDYLRGYYGLKITSGRLLDMLESTSKKGREVDAGDLTLPTVANVKKLNELATAKLGEITRRAASGERSWDGYGEAELKAARELVEKDAQKVQR